MVYEKYEKEKYTISTDPDSTDIEAVHMMLSKSYWAQTRPREIIEISIKNSLCFNLFDGTKQIGFARVVTDYAVFAYLCDIYIDENYRKSGLGKWMLQCILSSSALKNVKRILLATKDAHEFYKKFGFTALEDPNKYMVLSKEK